VEDLKVIDESDDDQLMVEMLADMVQIMDEMPSEYCDVLCRTELEGMSHKDYAERVGISATAAKTRAFRARIMLKDMLMKCCHYQFDKYGTVIDIHPAECCCCGHE
jgi:RNA polymerase sigma-70 factor (ECF subfamily)